MRGQSGIITAMDTIYIDSLFAINMAINYVILLATGKLSGAVISRPKLGIGAAVGGIYAVLTVLPQTAFLSGAAMKIVSAVFMLIIAFGREKHLFRTALIFFAVSAAFGGAVYAVSLMAGGTGSGAPYVPVSGRVLVLSFVFCYLLISVVFRRAGIKQEKEVLEIEMTLASRKISIRTLRDTGNSLYDPVSGAPIMVADKEALLKLFSDEAAKELCRTADPIEAMVALGRINGYQGRFRLIPYSAIGVDTGMLLCFRPDEVRVRKAPMQNLLVGISASRICIGGGYDAVI